MRIDQITFLMIALVLTFAVPSLAAKKKGKEKGKGKSASSASAVSSSVSSASSSPSSAASAAQNSADEELAKYHLKKGMRYEDAKAILTKDLWTVVIDPQDPTTSQNFPEVSCGQGKDSVCSVTFKKDTQELALSLENAGENGVESYRVQAAY